MQSIVRVFVSSTWLDLQPERLAVEKALQRMHQTKLNGMEYFGSRDETTRDVSLTDLDRSDVYVGIIGARYGSGITEEEYRRASEKKLPRFIYFKDEQNVLDDKRDPEQEKKERLATWKEELRKAHSLGTGPFTSPDDLAARVTADLSNWLLDRYGAQLYLDGVGSLPFDYAGRFENFLSEYLGTAKAPVPFGGREKDLKALDTWLDDPAAPPYFMMAAPAGRGKSALLVRWTHQVLARANIALVFVPISIRFRTNLSGVTFAALAARLARLHGDKIPDTPSTSVETWRGLVTEYLRRPLPSGEKLLLVLDGLDEAADWEAGPDLFPLTPPDHVRVIVSARYRTGDTNASDWLRRLGWERKGLARPIDLSTLTKEGIVRVLESMGFPLAQLGAKVDIVSELYRLTEGDPLLVKLYVEDLWSRKETVGSLKPEDLGKLKPGLTGYFDRWWADQRTLWGRESPLKERNVQTLLNVLACALGPLDQEALLRLTQLSSTWDLVEALKPLDRLIVGDGKVHGYVFSHPRLGGYFKDALSASEQQAWQQQFLDWGRDTVQALEQGTVAPAKAPAYIVQYYGAHLEQAHASAEAMVTLVCHGWSKAWETLEGSFSGFLNDVERAWRAAERDNEQAIAKGEIVPRIGDEIRCALVRTSINSLSANIGPQLLTHLINEGLWSPRQGLFYARQVPDLFDRADLLAHLASAIKVPYEMRQEILYEAVNAAHQIGTHHNTQSDLLKLLAPHRPDEVLIKARQLEDNSERANVLVALLPFVKEQAREQLLQEGLAAARLVNYKEMKIQILTEMAPHLPERQWEEILHEELAAARRIKDPLDRATVLTALASHLPNSESEKVLQSALVTAQRRHDFVLLMDVLTALARHRPEVALTVARKIGDNSDRATMLAILLPFVTEEISESLVQEILVAMQEQVKDNDWLIIRVLTELAPRRPEKALVAARAISLNPLRRRALLAIVSHLPASDRDVILQEELAAMRQIHDTTQRAHVLSALAPHGPQAVLTAAHKIEDSSDRAKVFVALLPFVKEQDREQLLREGLMAIRLMSDNEMKIQILTEMAPHLPVSDRNAVLQEALTLAQKIMNDGWSYIPGLGVLAAHLPEELLALAYRIDNASDRAEVLQALGPHRPEKVLAMTRQITDRFYRALTFATLLPFMTEKVRKSIVQETVAVAQQLDNSANQTLLLATLVPHVAKHDRGSMLADALAAARGIADHRKCAEMLAALVPYLEGQEREQVLAEALAVVREIKDDLEAAKALVTIAPYRPEAVLAAARECDPRWARATVLAAVTPHLQTVSTHLLYPLWRSTLRDLSTYNRAECMHRLSELIPFIEKLGQGGALKGTLRAVQDVTTWWP